MAIFRNKLKDFEKTIRDEALKWYFLNSPGQEEQFKLYFTPLPKVFENFCSTDIPDARTANFKRGLLRQTNNRRVLTSMTTSAELIRHEDDAKSHVDNSESLVASSSSEERAIESMEVKVELRRWVESKWSWCYLFLSLVGARLSLSQRAIPFLSIYILFRRLL